MLNLFNRLILSNILFVFLADVVAADSCLVFYRQTSKITGKTQAETSNYLRKVARQKWQFYSEHVNSETNFLPPDNVYVKNVLSPKKDKRSKYVAPEEWSNEAAAPRWMHRKKSFLSENDKNLQVANRTSPTNIGLYMLSTVTAFELGFITKEESLTRLRQTVETIKSLPKFTSTIKDARGKEHRVEHLYNWYTIKDKPQPMSDKYISTVDNGNFAANLVTVISALGKADPKLVKDLRHILETMRFDILFDPKEKLLYNGANIVNGKLVTTSGRYDMLISEARSAYLVAIMMGNIPSESWTRLKRKLGTELNNISSNPQLKLQSYTGTMFEYLMPSLFFKHEGTALGEADRQAVNHQMAESKLNIWGRSEVNSVTVNRYAAFGTPSLSQSREYIINGDNVFAPYASEMAAYLAPEKVANNLRRMDQLGVRERYGHFESVEFRGEGENMKILIIPQFFAHHVGMGFLGIANHLLGNKIPHWTHSSGYNKEKVLEQSLSTAVEDYRNPSTRKKSQKQNTSAYEAKVAYKKSDIIGNGGFTSYIPSLGGSTWMSGNGASYAISHNEFFYVRDKKSGELLKLDASKKPRSEGGTKFFDYQIKDSNGGLVDISIGITMSALSRTKVSKVTITNRGTQLRELEVVGYVEWIMENAGSYLEHPILRNLYTENQMDKSGRVISIQRRTMQGAEQERQPISFFGLGQETMGPADWASGSRLKALGRLGNVTYPEAIMAGKVEAHFGQTLDPAGVLAKALRIEPGQSKSVDFVLGVTNTRDNISNLLARAAHPEAQKQIASPTLPSESTVQRMQTLHERDEQSRRTQTRLPRPPQTDGKVENVIEWRKGGRILVNKDPFAQKKPWSMVLSNGKYGVVATHTGWAYSYGSNAQQGRVTPYRPDLTSEEPLRGVIFKDTKTGESWSITPNPAPTSKGHYEVETSPGYIKYKYLRPDGLAMEMTLFVAKDNPMEFWQIHVDNKTGKEVNLEVASFMKWAMGNQDPLSEKETVVTYDSERKAYFAQSPRALSPESVGFHSIIGDGLSVKANNQFGSKENPYHGLTTNLKIAAGETKQMSFVLGLGENASKSKKYMEEYKNVKQVSLELNRHLKHISSWLDGIQVVTPDKDFNTMSNTWLTYQAYVAHVQARSGFYQSGGAFGFRDQLQSMMNLVNTGQPFFWDLARKYILESSRHQFEKGDVQHWWHEKINLGGKQYSNYGQRSTITDNLLWLPLAINHYIEVTGDRSILKEMTPFSIPSRELRPGELDFAEPMGFSDYKVDVYQHAKRAIDLVINERMGSHGLPLIGKGDWNDGLDRVGHLGRGESVWTAFFLYKILKDFSKLAAENNDQSTADRYLKSAEELQQNIERHAWNGKFYVRGFADNGEVLNFNDAIVAGWAMISKAASPERVKSAVNHAVKELYKPNDRMILLFNRKLENEVWGGSLQAYPFGSRENWAQYTHGSQWLALAVLELGKTTQQQAYIDLGNQMLASMSPTAHINDPRYRGEPNAVAADISGAHKMGEAGWTWYSGAAGWLQRNNLETVLGLKFIDGKFLRFQPSIPNDWPGFAIVYKRGSTKYEINVETPAKISKTMRKVVSLTIDGVSYDPAVGIPLLDDGQTHQVKVIMANSNVAKKL